MASTSVTVARGTRADTSSLGAAGLPRAVVERGIGAASASTRAIQSGGCSANHTDGPSFRVGAVCRPEWRPLWEVVEDRPRRGGGFCLAMASAKPADSKKEPLLPVSQTR